MKPQIVIAGGGYAGLFAAARLRRSTGCDVILIDAKDHFIQRVRLHEALVGRPVESVPYRPLLEAAGITFIQGRIQGLQPDQQTLTLETGDGSVRILAYHWLLYALGSRTRAMPSIPGVDRLAHTLDFGPRLDQARQSLKALAPGRSVVIMGAGLTGLEAATEIKEAFPHLVVTLVCAGRAFAGYAAAADQEIRAVLQRLGIRLLEHKTITALDAHAIHCSDATVVACDWALHCMGFELGSLPREAGIRTASNGQIQVDAYLRSLSHPQILALGDAAELPATYCAVQRLSCALACPMGTYAGESLRRLQNQEKLLPFRFGSTGHCISLGRRAALVPLMQADDTPRSQVIRGRLAVWIKEMICRATVKVPLWELRTGLRLYRWHRPNDAWFERRRLKATLEAEDKSA